MSDTVKLYDENNNVAFEVPNTVVEEIANKLDNEGFVTETGIKDYNLYFQFQYYSRQLIEAVKKYSRCQEVICSATMTETDGLVYYLVNCDVESPVYDVNVADMVKEIYDGSCAKKEKLLNYIKISYKKLKANVFYDKTVSYLRDRIVIFEDDVLDEKIKLLCDALSKSDDDAWENLQREILSSVEVLAYPKKLSVSNKQNYIINSEKLNNIKIEKYQYMIDMDVQGHILGVLWILLFGKDFDSDDSMYKFSYGNRMRKNLYDDIGEPTFYPGLFEPYFSQYSAWRDRALDIAQKNLEKDNDVIVMTMDFKDFYYSVNYSEKEFIQFMDGKAFDKIGNNVADRINQFIYKIIKAYSEKLAILVKDATPWKSINGADNPKVNVLPIGFLPSNILANMRLNAFDKQINTRWNPLYYGRYVDDIIIVDKVDRHSHLHDMIYGESVEAMDVVACFFENCSAIKDCECQSKEKKSLLVKFIDTKEKSEKDDPLYYINPNMVSYGCDKNDEINGNSLILIQNSKVKVFAFIADATDSLLKCFQEEIRKNSSEFRYWPEYDTLCSSAEIGKLYNLTYNDTINKLNGVNGISLDKFELSKFLGKQMYVSSLTNGTKYEYLEDLLKIFTPRVLIEHYQIWERLIELFVLSKNYRLLVVLVEKIMQGIDAVCCDNEEWKRLCQKSLLRVIHAAFCRGLSLVSGKKIDEFVENSKEIKKLFNKGGIHDIKWIAILNIASELKEFKLFCRRYIQTRMLNKYLIPISLGFVINALNSKQADEMKEIEYELYDFDKVLELICNDKSNKDSYLYSPTVVTPQEINFALICKEIGNSFHGYDEEIKKSIKSNYLRLNFNIGEDVDTVPDIVKIFSGGNDNILAVSNKKLENLKVAIANVKVYVKDFEGVLMGECNRSIERYGRLESVLRSALKEKANLLVLPECYLPIQWLPRLMKLCADNQLAIITGLEHIILPRTDEKNTFSEKRGVHNLTAIILPYKDQNFKYACLDIHSKTDFSPEERKLIEGYNYYCCEGKGNKLYCWNNIWFSVFCCFELASIEGRARFSNYADFIIGVEWNKDVIYYSNIMESLSRDKHCYCIQVNSSDYGDSRIIQPSSSNTRNILRTKGGVNSTVLIESINIDKLRRFQLKQYALQKDDNSFKPTPPNFDRSAVMHKIKGTLDTFIKNKCNALCIVHDKI